MRIEAEKLLLPATAELAGVDLPLLELEVNVSRRASTAELPGCAELLARDEPDMDEQLSMATPADEACAMMRLLPKVACDFSAGTSVAREPWTDMENVAGATIETTG